MEDFLNSRGYICQPSDFVREHLNFPLGMGYIVNDRCFEVRRNYFPGHLIMYCISGKLHIEQYGTASVLHPGYCCLMTLEEAHNYYSDAEDPCELLWLHFNGKHLHEMLHLIFENTRKYRIIQNSRLLPVLRECILNYESDSSGSCFSNSSNIYYLMTVFLEETIRSGSQKTISLSPLTRELDSFLNEHIKEKITLKRMAEQCHLNSSYFCRRFHAETNMTPMQYLMQKRIELAKYYLIYTQKQMSLISEELGFYDQNYFSLCFLKATGLSPTQYRKQNQGVISELQ